MMMDNTQSIKSKAITGSVWALAENFSVQIVQFVVGIVLARLLEPKDYGLIAITGIFTTIAGSITDAGFEKTLIQRKEVSQIQISSIFYINILLGLVITLIVVFCAPTISSFFNEPRLTLVLQIVSSSIFVMSLGQTQQALLMKEFHMKVVSYSRITGSIISAVVGLVMAYLNCGVWALVFSMLAFQIVRVVYLWIKSSWKPSFTFSLSSVRPMIRYGLNVLGSSIIFYILQQFNNFIVGKFYTKDQLGFFYRGSKFPELIISIVQSVVLKMAFPIFSKLQDNNAELTNAFSKTIKLVSFIIFPIFAILFIKAEDITIVLFTEKWRGSIIFLELFCIVKIFEPLISIHRELMLSKGNSKLLLIIFFIKLIVEVSLIMWFIRFGIIYIVVATIISRIVQYALYSIASHSVIQVSILVQLSWLVPYILITSAMGVIVICSNFAFIHFFGGHFLIVKLFGELIIAFLSYIAMAYYFKFSEILLLKPVFNKLVFRNKVEAAR